MKSNTFNPGPMMKYGIAEESLELPDFDTDIEEAIAIAIEKQLGEKDKEIKRLKKMIDILVDKIDLLEIKLMKE